MAAESQPTCDEIAGISWWNSMDGRSRAFWLGRAGPSAATAWAYRQRLAGASIRTDGEQSRGNFVGRLVVLTCAAQDGDASARSEVLCAGEILRFAGGSVTLLEARDLVRDYLRNHPAYGDGHDIAASLMSYWEHIPSSLPRSQ